MVTPTLERRLAAVWFADIVDFTRLSASDEPMAYRVMEAMRASVRESVQANGGDLVKYLGDGALAHFPSAEAAVEAALQVHRRFRAATRLLPGPHALRVGVHLGEVAVGPDGDLFGDGVNRAARLQEMADPGQVLVSQAVRELLRQRPELVFTSKGKRTAKGLDDPVQVFEAQARGNLSDRLEAVERTTDPVSPAPEGRKPGGLRHPRAIASGIAAGIVAFVGLGIYTAWGGTPAPEAVAEAPASVVMIPVVDSLPGEGPLPRWPAVAVEPEPDPEPEPTRPVARPAPEPTPAQRLRALASETNQRLRSIPEEETGWHETLPILRRAVDEVLVGSPTGARADVLRGLLLFLDRRDFEGAEKAYQSALAADAESTSTRRLYAQLLTAMGRSQEALYQLQEAERAGLDPAALHLQRGSTLLRSGRPQEAERELRQMVERRDGGIAPRILLARALVARGEHDAAARVLAEGAPSLPTALWTVYARLRQGGRAAEQARVGLPSLVRAAADLPDGPYLLAVIMVAAGQERQAFDQLDAAIRADSPSLVWLGVDPEWEAYRTDPRYLLRLHRVGLTR